MANDRRTRAYVTRRTREGKTTRDIIRYLKRAVARQVFHLLTHPQPAIAVTGLRTARKRLGLTLNDVAVAVDSNPSKLSLLERGLTHDDDFTARYRHWLREQGTTNPAHNAA